jgi:probable H4MPT-linked C1 transfer pathway protein
MTVGWDIGGVNTKVALVSGDAVVAVRQRPYELQKAPHALGSILRELAQEVGAGARSVHAVTMTAELSQLFRTKREGVRFVLDAVQRSFPSSPVHVFSVDGRFLTPDQARAEPLAVAAANWSATAHAVATRHADALLIDVGTTTADVIPLAGGRVVAAGRTDPERLMSGELVYTGALRTPTEAIVTHVPLNGLLAGVSAEGFALSGDAHVWRGDLAPADYTVPTPDGRPATRAYAGERLARMVCADRDMLDEDAISAIAAEVARAQVARLAAAIRLVVARHPLLEVAIVTGLGSFLASAATRAAGLRVVPLSHQFGEAGARCAPAVAVAILLERSLATHVERGAVAPGRPAPHSEQRLDDAALTGGVPEIVVKIGGGSLAAVDEFDAVLTAIDEAADCRVLIVPGGGPFADAVRAVDRQVGVADEAAHWMAVLAMDQFAHLVASRLKRGALVREIAEIADAVLEARVPVLAPYQWLRRVDPLPHSWDVTSDSIAAWVAGVIGAPRLLLVKPAGARGERLVDAHFDRVLPAHVAVEMLGADQVIDLRVSLGAGAQC